MASSPSNNLRWTPNASPISSPVPPPLFSPEISSSQVDDEPFMSPAHHHELKQKLDQYVDEPAKNDAVVNSLRVSGHQSSKKKGSEENKSSFVIKMELKSEGGTVVCVRVPTSSSKGNDIDIAIIEGLNGYAQPGEVLAIMGPSGSGKSTLLDALAGRLPSNTRQLGLIHVNGRKQRLSFGTSVRIIKVVYYSALLQLPDSMTTSEKKERAETTIKVMGLHEARNTKIGGWNIKGLSGVQKRRVSICIEILTRPKLLFLDEPTSGLDSAASYHVVNRIAKLSRQYRMTVIASIHQPSSEVFNLFHNLCLLSSGRTIYFGPASAANGDTEKGFGGKVTTTEEAIYKLAESYKSSQIFQQVKLQVSNLCKRLITYILEKGTQASFLTQSVVLTRRSFLNMHRNLGYYWLRLGAYIGLGLCVGTIFLNIGTSFGSIQARGSILLFVVAFLTFMAIGGFPSFVEDMKIFGRERLNGHYGVAAFVVGNTLSSVPYLLMISLLPGALAYYLVGLHKGYEHFLFFALLLFVCMMLVESLMMVVASIVPDFLMGIIVGAGIQGAMILNAGFFRLPNDLPNPVWKYPMYNISFHRYANEGFYKNELQGLQFPNNQIGGSSTIRGGSSTISGEEILKNIWQMPTGYSKWVDLAVLFGMVVLYRLMFFSIIKLSEKKKSSSCLNR
ncbi:hypothetical protein MKW98_023109 [Papaver atlanticum]|uniref:ABC transporter domain-containing protein n=1 Tax=Papaver atlanticum TaxID=357466 RepID=A0AAD4XUD4_9MAGN|nr:hypothetical protein MKW98_023109 [Papaver atlanticum]